MFVKKLAQTILISTILIPSIASACDLCSIYNSLENQKPVEGRFSFAVSEEFKEYGRIQTEGVKIENHMHQRLESSITQLVASYDLSSRLAIQTVLPYINRRFNRLEGEMMEKGTEAGIGDMTILARFQAWQFHKEDQYFGVQLLGGIKLPTGSSSRLKEEISEEMPVDHEHMRHGDEEHAGAVHGHDLALGSGSVDFPVGVSVLAETGRAFIKGSAIYSFRTEGDHSYRYADDIQYDFGPAYYLYLKDDSRVAARLAISGEYKARDTGAGDLKQDDTGISSMFWGPELSLAINDSLAGDIGFDMPIGITNTGTQAVASYKLHAALTYNF